MFQGATQPVPYGTGKGYVGPPGLSKLLDTNNKQLPRNEVIPAFSMCWRDADYTPSGGVPVAPCITSTQHDMPIASA